jgi:hypothetical protein
MGSVRREQSGAAENLGLEQQVAETTAVASMRSLKMNSIKSQDESDFDIVRLRVAITERGCS